MNEVQVVGSLERFSLHESQEESLEKALESLVDHLYFSSFTGWRDNYGAYLVLKAIFSNIQDQDVTAAFNHFEDKVQGYLKNRFYFYWNHYEFIELIDNISYKNATICSDQLKADMICHLKTLLPEIDDACNGAINNQSSLSLIFGQLTAIGFILQDTQLSTDLQAKGKEIVNTWFFPRFGHVAPSLKARVNELLDLLEKS